MASGAILAVFDLWLEFDWKKLRQSGDLEDVEISEHGDKRTHFRSPLFTLAIAEWKGVTPMTTEQDFTGQ
jgi:hypothetical protein